MDIVKIVLNTFFSALFLLFITKMIGSRQLSELSLFDYINGITIGSIAAEMATSKNFGDAFLYLISMLVYGLFAIIIAYMSDKSLKMRYIINGKPILLMYEGKLYYDNFKKAKLDINEFLVRARNSGYFDINELHTAVFETNGKVSFLPKAENKPVISKDLKLNLPNDYPVDELIVDGVIIERSLEKIGKDTKWLMNELKNKRIIDVNDVFLATYDIKGNLKVYFKNKGKGKN